jgi:UDPglucose--hexose-1-phosphate uridylyltransferase
VAELRHDALTGRLVLLAPGRATRPDTHDPSPDDVDDDPENRPGCPFCPEHEHETPPEVARVGDGAPDTSGWSVRVVPNLYPIVGGDGSGPGATGAHEVAILSPDHRHAFHDLDDEQAMQVLTMLRDRARVHAETGSKYVQVLVNHGQAAGASIAHPHAQLLALDLVPPAVAVAVERFGTTGKDLLLEDQAEALDAGTGIVVGTEVRAWCPTAAASPFETRIAALGTGARFDRATDGEVLGVAIVLRNILAAMARALAAPAYNVVVHTAPSDDALPYHWWAEVVPRISIVAGFELGTGLAVNTVDPGVASRRLLEHL